MTEISNETADDSIDWCFILYLKKILNSQYIYSSYKHFSLSACIIHIPSASISPSHSLFKLKNNSKTQLQKIINRKFCEKKRKKKTKQIYILKPFVSPVDNFATSDFLFLLPSGLYAHRMLYFKHNIHHLSFSSLFTDDTNPDSRTKRSYPC